MIRMLSLITVAMMLFSCATATAQEKAEGKACPAPKCPNCQAAELELVGVEIPLDTSADDTKKAVAGKNGIAIKIKCSSDIPFLSNLPILGHSFKSEDCDVILFDAACDCEQSEEAGICCPHAKSEPLVESPKGIKVQIACDEDLPFGSNIPYVNRLFKNAGLEACQTDKCQEGDCPASCSKATCQSTCSNATCQSACSKATCASACCGNMNCEAPACRANTLVELVSHHEALTANDGPTREELMHEVMEVHVENARLETRVEAMEQHMELMEELAEVRAENAGLQARLEMMEKQNTRTTAVFHARPATTHAHAPYAVLGVPHTPHAPHGPHTHANHTVDTPAVGGHFRFSTGVAVPGNVKLPPARAAIFATETPDTEIQRMVEHLRVLQKQVKLPRSECSKNEASCKKATLK